LLSCNNFNGASFIILFLILCYEAVVLNIILLEVARELSRFCKMVRRSKVVGQRWLSPIDAIAHFEYACEYDRVKRPMSDLRWIDSQVLHRPCLTTVTWTHLRTRSWRVFTLQGTRRFATRDWPMVLRKLPDSWKL